APERKAEMGVIQKVTVATALQPGGARQVLDAKTARSVLSPTRYMTRLPFPLSFDDPSSPLGPLQVGFFAPYMEVRGNPGIVYVPVQLSHVPGEVVSVGFYPREGPATSNYRWTAGTLRFLPGTQAQQIAVQILTNSQSSGFTMHLVLTSPMGAGAVLGQYPVFSLGVVR